RVPGVRRVPCRHGICGGRAAGAPASRSAGMSTPRLARWAFAALAAVLGVGAPVIAQVPDGVPGASARDSAQAREAAGLLDEWGSLRVYLLTMGPGDAVWERFGHNAILLRDTTRGIAVAYHYGMFSFDEPGIGRRLRLGRRSAER